MLIESPEVLNIIQENHIKSIISLLDKHGRNHKVGSTRVCKATHTRVQGHVCARRSHVHARSRSCEVTYTVVQGHMCARRSHVRAHACVCKVTHACARSHVCVQGHMCA